MTQISRPWSGTSVGDAGPYSHTQWHELYRALFSNLPNAGIVVGSNTLGQELRVVAQSPNSTSLDVQAGTALVKGIGYSSDAVVTLNFNANASGNARIDAVVLEADFIQQIVRLSIVEGTPAATPLPPTLNQGAVLYQIALAHVTLANGYVSISQDNVSDQRTFLNAPEKSTVQIVNNTASVIPAGNVVTWATSVAYNRVQGTTASGRRTAAGITEARLPGSGAGRIIRHGLARVICQEQVAINDRLITGTTSGQARKANASSKAWGFVVVANTGAGTACLAFVDFSNQLEFSSCKVTGSADVSLGHQAVTTMQWNTEVWDDAFLNYHDNAVNNTRLTARSLGKHTIKAFIHFSNTLAINSIIEVQGRLMLNGSTIITIPVYAVNVAAASGVGALIIDHTLDLALDDYVELEIFQQNTAAGNILLTGTGTGRSWMQIEYKGIE